MKKIYNMIMLFAIALAGLSLTACSEDDLDTNQYGKGVSLSAYGPQPVMRGGTLRFLGSNLDQIAQIIIPGMEDSPITNFEVVQAGVPSEIRVVLPKDGPEVGYVTLITKTDEKITTITQLTYEEPIEITGFTPASVMPGEEITIEGDYLNLVEMVEFADGVQVSQDDFTEHTRYKIVVKVPEEARTGKLNLYTLDLTKEENSSTDLTYNIMEAEDALTVGTPTVTKLASPRGEAETQGAITAKKGETITITGEHFNLVDEVSFSNVDEDGTLVNVATNDFAVSEDGKTLTLILPAEAPDGDINLVARSGVEIPVGTLTTVAPSECVAAPSPVKAGAALTITGKDLDVVSMVEMLKIADSEGNQETITSIEFTVNDDGTQLVITAVPDDAVEGSLTLRMANGKGVEVAFTLVKPAVTSYNSASVSAGGALTLNGTDLDLVKSVKFGEAEVTEFTSQSETAITLTVPMEATSGPPVLTLANGTTVDAPELTIEEAVFCYATSLPSEDEEIKAGTSVTLTVKNMDKLTGVEIDGTTCQYITSGEETLIIGVPETAGSGSKVKLISSNGEITYTIDFIPATEVSKVVWSGLTQLSWSDGGRVIIPASSFEDVPEGAILTLCYSQVDQQWDQAQINFGDWSGCDWTIQAHDGETLLKTSFTQTLIPTDIYGWFTDGILNRETQLVLTQDILDNIQAKKGSCEDVTDAGIIIQGSGLTFSKVTLSYTRSLETNINADCVNQNDQSVAWTFPTTLTWSDEGRFRILRNGTNDLQSKSWKAGKSVLRIYKSGTGQAQINDPNWNSFTILSDWNGDVDVLELTLTQDIIDCFTGTTSDGWSGTALIIQGDGITISKITVEP